MKILILILQPLYLLKKTKALVHVFRLKNEMMDETKIQKVDHESEPNESNFKLGDIISLAIESRQEINHLGSIIIGLMPKNDNSFEDNKPGLLQPVWLNSNQVAALLNVSGRTLRRYRREKLINCIVVKGWCRYRYQEVIDFMKKLSAASSHND